MGNTQEGARDGDGLQAGVRLGQNDEVGPRGDDTPVTDRIITQNWEELLQEIRVLQTGVQILTGFLLTLPFSSRFTDLDTLQVRTYLAVLCGSVLTTALVVSPVAFHRALFRRRQRPWLVTAANHTTRAALATLGLTSCGVLFLVFDVVTDRTLSVVVLAISLLAFVLLWAVVPLMRRGQVDDEPEAARQSG